MITSNYRLTRVQVYKAIKEYSGDDLVDDLTLALLEHNLDILNDKNTLKEIREKSYPLTPLGESYYNKYRQISLNHLRCFKTLKLKNKSKK